MKNLEFVELNAQEMEEVNGGILGALGWLIAGIVIAEMLDRNSGNDFREGFNDAWK